MKRIVIKRVSIYALINPINGHVFYIGATINPSERLIQHIAEIKYIDSFKNDNIRAILSHGLKVEMEILDECDSNKTSFWEEFYIDLFSSFGYTLNQSRKSSYSQKILYDKNVRLSSIGVSENIYSAIKIISEETGFSKSSILNIAMQDLIRKIVNQHKPSLNESRDGLLKKFGITNSYIT